MVCNTTTVTINHQ